MTTVDILISLFGLAVGSGIYHFLASKPLNEFLERTYFMFVGFLIHEFLI